MKGREEAESEILRSRAWDWWENVALTRLAPGGVCCLMMTRWHESDLAGTILSRPSPLAWRVLRLPAISEGPGDPLGRPAEAEFPSIRGRAPGYFTHRRATMTPYIWASIYDQKPTAAVGNFFRRTAFRYWRPVAGIPDPAAIIARRTQTGAWIELEGRRVDLTDHGVWKFATCDLAASEKTSADWTVVARCGPSTGKATSSSSTGPGHASRWPTTSRWPARSATGGTTTCSTSRTSTGPRP